MNKVKHLKTLFASALNDSLESYHSAVTPEVVKSLVIELDARRNQKALGEDAYVLLGIMKTWIGSTRASSSMDGKKLWDRIDLIEAGRQDPELEITDTCVSPEDTVLAGMVNTEAERVLRAVFEEYNAIAAKADPRAAYLQPMRNKIDYLCTPTRVETLLHEIDKLRATVVSFKAQA